MHFLASLLNMLALVGSFGAAAAFGLESETTLIIFSLGAAASFFFYLMIAWRLARAAAMIPALSAEWIVKAWRRRLRSERQGDRRQVGERRGARGRGVHLPRPAGDRAHERRRQATVLQPLRLVGGPGRVRWREKV
ncbi:MAG: hypothetical protein R3D25_10120 [Geminicoccaceae bacterium]